MNKRLLFFIKYFLLSIAALFIIIPFWMMIVTSFKNTEEARDINISIPKEFVGLSNYKEVLSNMNFPRILFNSILITLSSVIIIIFISSLAAYIISRREDKKSRFIFYYFMIGMVFPPSVIITVIMLKNLHILGSYLGMILYYAGALLAFPLFILIGFMATIPKELEEAALIDGASPVTVYFRIILPLLRPPIITVFIWGVMLIWNDFLMPLYILSGNTKLYTLVLSVYRYKSLYRTEWNLVFALLILVSLPVIIVFIILQKKIAEGMTAGAIKG